MSAKFIAWAISNGLGREENESPLINANPSTKIVNTRWPVAMDFPPGSAGSEMSAVNLHETIFKMAEQLQNLDLRGNFEGTERGEKFWNRHELEMKFTFERAWIRSVRNAPRKPNYSMGELDSIHEEVCGNRLELSGPLIDTYLKEIGKGIQNKLTHSRATGLATPVTLFIPLLIFRHILTLIRGYGGDIVNDNKKDIICCTLPIRCVKRLFSPRRFSGENYLQKRVYSKHLEDGKTTLKLKEKSHVVVSDSTPFLLQYCIKKQKITSSFYVQRYDKDNFAVDVNVQDLLA